MLANHTGVMLTSLRTIVYSSYHTVIPHQDKNTHIHHFFYSPLRPRVFTVFVHSFTLRSAAPHTALWGGPWPRFEPMTPVKRQEAGTLATRPLHLLTHLHHWSYSQVTVQSYCFWDCLAQLRDMWSKFTKPSYEDMSTTSLGINVEANPLLG